ncbi:MAG: hypothetical protein NWE76_02055 [Candidatus Bathyarchaeota archaeon]|jgi:hypothetical protein|nr:hypothetical protein [Candidatus Bathyarchaeota archaeon]
MVMLDDYRKGWALRYIREARDELKTSQRTSHSLSLIVDAARKAQAAIYYSLGDPSSVEGVVNEVSDGARTTESPVLRCLVDIERTLQRMEHLPASTSEEASREADEIIRIASTIVDLLTSED